MKPLNVTLRTLNAEQAYQNAIAAGKTRSLEFLPSIQEWKYWRLVANEYPYNVGFRQHDLLVLKRNAAERFDLNKAERDEFEQILKDFVYPNYDFWFENCPKRRSSPGIYHIHMVVHHARREDMKL